MSKRDPKKKIEENPLIRRMTTVCDHYEHSEHFYWVRSEAQTTWKLSGLFDPFRVFNRHSTSAF
jgi:hypothetical protein